MGLGQLGVGWLVTTFIEGPGRSVRSVVTHLDALLKGCPGFVYPFLLHLVPH